MRQTPRINGPYRLDAVRGHLFERAGDVDKAVHHYRAAAGRTLSTPERDYLTAKAAGYASNWLIATPAATGTAFTAERTEVAEKR